MLIFVCGFMATPGAYSLLLEPLRQAGVQVRTPRFYGPLAGLTGNYTAAAETRDLVALVRSLAADPASPEPTRPWLAGHSRGGQVVWRAAEELGTEISGLMVIDPVDGSGPRSTKAPATDHPAHIKVPTLIIGAGRGGACAPAALNHERFAAALPSATHTVLPDMGHADMMSGRALRWGRRLCSGGRDPQASRAQVSNLMLSWMTDSPSAGTEAVADGD